MPGRFAIAIMCLVVIAGCDREEKQRQEIVERGVQIKLEQYSQRQEALCKREAIEKAIVIADSLMRLTGPKTVVNVGEKPPPAFKPLKPPVKQLPDTLKHDALRKD